MSQRVVLIDGARTPFLRAGTEYFDLMNYQLGAFAIKGLIDKTGIDNKIVDEVVLGTVVHNVQTPNVAREAALTAGLSYRTPCHTVSQACISANQAISRAADLIRLGHAEIVIAGGTECTSDTPIVYRKQMRKKLFKAQKLKTPLEVARFAATLRPSDFMPERPAVAEMLTGKLMGEDCEMLVAKFQVTRQAQDEFALRSHTLAQQATNEGTLAKEITTVELPPKFKSIQRDNGIRVAPLDQLAKLRPAFVKPHGSITAANASFLTDGAAVVMLMSEDKARQLGLTPKAVIHDYLFTSSDIRDELLLGPAYAISKILKRNNLQLDQMDVIELHEAFAGQVLANIAALASDNFCREKLGREQSVGQVNMDKLNRWGGSLSIGHPFGATGARIMTTTANRLIAENGKYGLLAACAAGAHGHATILERYAA
ncbi:MAG: acetyl-CoA C-acyltransferase [Pirellulaceae bacterium]|nr:acetyl-CoA C-acyltransferase [Pirellulaceae bacterium]